VLIELNKESVRLVFLSKSTDFSEDPIASIFTVEEEAEEEGR
jgi:hypothetical protein